MRRLCLLPLLGILAAVVSNDAISMVMAENTMPGTNVAIYGTAFQSTLGDGNIENSANWAIDGNFNSWSETNTSRDGPVQWWKVVLDQSYLIGRVGISGPNLGDWSQYFNRVGMIEGTEVFVADTDTPQPPTGGAAGSLSIGVITLDKNQRWESANINRNMSVLWLVMHVTEDTFLCPAEVEVFTKLPVYNAPTPAAPKPPNTNLIQSVKQSSTLVGTDDCPFEDSCVAEIGNDGLVADSVPWFSTQCVPESWWRADLGSDQRIGAVKLWNRVDSNTAYGRIVGVQIFVTPEYMGDNLPNLLDSNLLVYTVPIDIAYNGGAREVWFNPDKKPVGRYVWIVKNTGLYSNCVSFREVQIFSEGSVEFPNHCVWGKQLNDTYYYGLTIATTKNVFDAEKCRRLCQDDPECFIYTLAPNGDCSTKLKENLSGERPWTGYTAFICNDHPSGTVAVKVPTVTGTAVPGTNLALSGNANQSSTQQDYGCTAETCGAQVAIDGSFTNGLTTQTNFDKVNEWWRVDLGAVFEVEYIRIYNREGSGVTRNRLAYGKVYLSTWENSPDQFKPPTNQQLLLDWIYAYVYDYRDVFSPNKAMIGQVVWIVQEYNYFNPPALGVNVREVQVWSKGSEAVPGHCRNSTLQVNDTMYISLSDVGNSFPFSSLTVGSYEQAANLDTCRRWCSFNPDCYLFTRASHQDVYKCFLYGRDSFVKVKSSFQTVDRPTAQSAVCADHPSVIALQPPTLAASQPGANQNMALGKITTASSQLREKGCDANSCSSDKGVDGLDSTFFSTQCTANQYWRVDLGGNYAVGAIEIMNVADPNAQHYLAGSEVYLSPGGPGYEEWQDIDMVRDPRLRFGVVPSGSAIKPPNSLWMTPPQSADLQVAGSVGQYVWVFQERDCLQAAEIRVWSNGTAKNYGHCDAVRLSSVIANKQYSGSELSNELVEGQEQPLRATGLNDCAARCKNVRACVAFTFWSTTLTCKYHSIEAVFNKQPCEKCSAAVCSEVVEADPLPAITTAISKPPNTNLALSAGVSDSSVYDGPPCNKDSQQCGAQRVIDSNFDTYMHTMCSGIQWLLIDLQVDQNIGYIKLFNRPGYEDRLALVNVHVIGSQHYSSIKPGMLPDQRTVVATLPSKNVPSVIKLESEDGGVFKGRYVMLVQQRSNCLHLMEVQVFSPNSVDNPTHCALLKSSYPSTDFPGYTLRTLSAGSLEQCRVECQKDLDCLMFVVKDTECILKRQEAVSNSVKCLACTGAVCDDHPSPIDPLPVAATVGNRPNENLAKGATLLASSSGTDDLLCGGASGSHECVPYSAVDGDKSNKAPIFISQCGGLQYLRVDLKENYEIGFVKIYNNLRQKSGLNGARLYVVPEEWTTINGGLHPPSEVPTDLRLLVAVVSSSEDVLVIKRDKLIAGRFVWLVGNDKCLGMREIEVYTPGSAPNPDHCVTVFTRPDTDYPGDALSIPGSGSRVASLDECRAFCQQSEQCMGVVLTPDSKCYPKSASHFDSQDVTRSQFTTAFCNDYIGYNELPSISVAAGPGPNVNLAREPASKTTFMSDVDNFFPCSQVVCGARWLTDGKKQGSDRYTRTGQTDMPWIRVDLGRNYEIGLIVLYGLGVRPFTETDVSKQLIGARVYVVPDHPDFEPLKVPTGDPRLHVHSVTEENFAPENVQVIRPLRQSKGRYVWVVHKQQYLGLVELEVLTPGSTVNPDHCTSFTKYEQTSFSGEPFDLVAKIYPVYGGMEGCRQRCQNMLDCALFTAMKCGDDEPEDCVQCVVHSKEAVGKMSRCDYCSAGSCSDFEFDVFKDVTTEESPEPNTNLALKRTDVTQSSIYMDLPSLGPAAGVDGSLATDNFFHTNGQGQQWWRVNLEANYVLGMVKLINRQDDASLQQRIIGANVYAVPNTAAFKDEVPTDSRLLVFRVSDIGEQGAITWVSSSQRVIKAQYIYVVQENNFLHLTEVQVFSEGTDEYGDHCQSSKGPLRGTCWLAGDAGWGLGKTDEDCRLRCRANPKCLVFTMAWGNCFMNTAEAFVDSTSQPDCTSYTCNDFHDDDPLPEVKPIEPIVADVNLATGATASISSPYKLAECETTCDAGAGIDGKLETMFRTGCATDVQQWYRLDLKANYTIGTVRLYNRKDRPDLMDQARVYLSYKNEKQPPTESATYLIKKYDFADSTSAFTEFSDIVPPERNNKGQFLWIVKPAGGCLNLREVQVWTPGSVIPSGHCPTADQVDGWEYYGEDIGISVPLESYKDCLTKCQATDACFTFVYAFGWCTLKKAAAAANKRPRADATAPGQVIGAICSDNPLLAGPLPDVITVPSIVDVNLAAADMASAVQSSVYVENGESMVADRGIDGSRATFFATKCLPSQWWRLDLGANYDIGFIRLYNRVADDNPTIGKRIIGAHVYVTSNASDNDVPTDVRLVASSIYTAFDRLDIVPAGYASKGRYVWVVKTSGDFCLHLSEVEVWSKGSQPDEVGSHCLDTMPVLDGYSYGGDHAIDGYVPVAVDGLEECRQQCAKFDTCQTFTLHLSKNCLLFSEEAANAESREFCSGCETAICKDSPKIDLTPPSSLTNATRAVRVRFTFTLIGNTEGVTFLTSLRKKTGIAFDSYSSGSAKAVAVSSFGTVADAVEMATAVKEYATGPVGATAVKSVFVEQQCDALAMSSDLWTIYDGCDGSSSSLGGGAVAGIVIGGVAAVALVAALSVFVCKRTAALSSKPIKHTSSTSAFPGVGGTSSVSTMTRATMEMPSMPAIGAVQVNPTSSYSGTMPQVPPLPAGQQSPPASQYAVTPRL